MSPTYLLFYAAAALIHLTSAISYDQYILAPNSRTLHPESVYSSYGNVSNAGGITTSGSGTTTFGPSSYVVYDYGKMVGGLVSCTVISSTSTDGAIGFTYSESDLFISPSYSNGLCNGYETNVAFLNVTNMPGTYVNTPEHMWGAFRYLTVLNNSTSVIQLSDVTTNFTAAPVNDLRGYTGYFHSNDELLNKIWYAGAYTCQLCTIDPTHGDSADSGKFTNGLYDWELNITITNGTSTLVDGAKRDRNVWPGDMVIGIPTIGVSTYDMPSIKNAIDSLLVLQLSNGVLPYYGRTNGELIHSTISDTYHLHNLISLLYYYVWSGDQGYLNDNWQRLVNALAWSTSNIDSSGLLNVVSSADWGRGDMTGHNIEANAILYYTLSLASDIGTSIGQQSEVSQWRSFADGIKNASNTLLWDSSAGLYKDNENSALYPQDGNSWAIKANLTNNAQQSESISQMLQARWNAYGAPTPEASDTISPFIGGIEAEAHFLAQNETTALELFRLEWGYMLNNEHAGGSTFVEAYSTDGEFVYFTELTKSMLSFTHAWSTAPTTLLSTYVAGIKLLTNAGQTWSIAPQVGDLTDVSAGYSTTAGDFSVNITADGKGSVQSMTFCTPTGTEGILDLGDQGGSISPSSSQGDTVTLSGKTNVRGGCWTYSVS